MEEPYSLMARRGKRAFSLMEVLVASMVAAVALLGMVRLWSFSFNATRASDQQGVGYNLGRQALERIKLTGFDYTTEGSVVRYYNGQGKDESSVQKRDSIYRMNVTIATDKLAYHSETGETRPAWNGLREVLVQVQRIGDNRTVFSGRTNLARSGL
jgi:prepilin-type N-terminal cleavage/methylation domain-containing protein